VIESASIHAPSASRHHAHTEEHDSSRDGSHRHTRELEERDGSHRHARELVPIHPVVSHGGKARSHPTSRAAERWAWAQLSMPTSLLQWLLIVVLVAAGVCGQLAVATGARTTTASKTALLAMNELAFAYALDVGLLGEPTSLLSAVGTLIVFVGSALVAAGPDISLGTCWPKRALPSATTLEEGIEETADEVGESKQVPLGGWEDPEQPPGTESSCGVADALTRRGEAMARPQSM